MLYLPDHGNRPEEEAKMERNKVAHYGATYEQFAAKVYGEVRARAFG